MRTRNRLSKRRRRLAKQQNKKPSITAKNEAVTKILNDIWISENEIENEINMSEQRLSIIVPYRNREKHLATFVPYMNEFMKRKHPNLKYEIFLIEQDGDKLFNRQKLLNIGFDLTKDDFTYFCFHDVDMLPISNCDYSFNGYPTRVWSFLSQRDQKREMEKKNRPKDGLIKPVSFGGGIVILGKQDFIDLNGYSNNYYGWGPGDRDMFKRCCLHKKRLVQRLGLYKSLPHKKAHCSQNRKDLEKHNPVLLKNRKYFGSIWGFIQNDKRKIIIGRVIRPYLKVDFFNLELPVGEADKNHPLNDGLSSLSYSIVKTEEDHGIKKYVVDL